MIIIIINESNCNKLNTLLDFYSPTFQRGSRNSTKLITTAISNNHKKLHWILIQELEWPVCYLKIKNVNKLYRIIHVIYGRVWAFLDSNSLLFVCCVCSLRILEAVVWNSPCWNPNLLPFLGLGPCAMRSSAGVLSCLSFLQETLLTNFDRRPRANVPVSEVNVHAENIVSFISECAALLDALRISVSAVPGRLPAAQQARR